MLQPTEPHQPGQGTRLNPLLLPQLLASDLQIVGTQFMLNWVYHVTRDLLKDGSVVIYYVSLSSSLITSSLG